jgi:cytosine/creatinine deaminase
MCAGAMIWFKVAKVVIGDAVNMTGREELLRSHGIEVVVLNDQRCLDLLTDYKKKFPERLAGA